MSQSTSTGPDRTRRVAVVTGGSGGIGRACAERLGADGFAVVVHYAGNPQRAEEVARAVVAAGGLATTAQADVAAEDQVAAVFTAAESEFGGVDVVVNTAGIMRLAPLAQADLKEGGEVDGMVRTNLRGTLVVSAEALRRLRDGGALVNVSTSVTRLALPTYAAYVATKGAVEAMTPILAKEVAGRDVTVNTVAPGPTATPLFLDGKDEETIARMASMNPMGRLGEPADIAEVVAFLAGPGRWVNGQVVFANGGAA
ncbi:3-oxoacyl-[acyl-carrier protein] reductase [Geodermatophilus nigrescens]|uniref:3-oxoacyl-[acyl-carrier protein] reductase n=1 Tax=Geodermatophilus nigrescens TaxID=1070870 RepID=A0A1M5EVK6_9ACTN|nr:3-oxoacyl-[acyl-carrier protein] reductase [Geodermatophilus nigrescens]